MKTSSLAWISAVAFPFSLYFTYQANPEFYFFKHDQAKILHRPPWPQTANPKFRLKNPGRSPRMHRADFRRTGDFGKVFWDPSQLTATAVAVGNFGIHTASKAAAVADPSGLVWSSDTGTIAKTNLRGDVLWGRSFYDSGFGIHSTPASDANHLYVSSYNGFTEILEPSSGRSLMSIFTAHAMGASPLLVRNQLIQAVETYEPNGYVFRWDLSMNKAVWVSAWLGEHAHSSVSYDPKSDLLFVGVNNGRFVAIDFKTGLLKWDIKTGGPIKSTPTVGSSLVYATSWDGRLRAVDPFTGSVRWEFAIGQHSQNSPAFSADLNSVFVFNTDQQLCRLHAESGQVVWCKGRRLKDLMSSPILFSSSKQTWVGYTCASAGYCIADAKDGKLMREFDVGSVVNGEAMVFAHGILVSTFDGTSRWLRKP